MTSNIATAVRNRQITLAARPKGFPQETDFRLKESPVAALEDGQLLIRTLMLSIDPYMRAAMNEQPPFGDPLPLGGVMVGGILGQVADSRHPRFRRGEYVEARLGWQEYAITDGTGVRKVDLKLGPPSTALYVLGMPGMTAYFGLLEVGRPNAGETVVVSAAAGAVGSLVGQIAKIKGCRAIGIAGSPEKVRSLTDEFGYDAAIDYKVEKDIAARLQALCPAGVDVYFDNVGGAVSDAVLRALNMHARIVVCGQISQYNLTQPENGPRTLPILLGRQARAEGFLVYSYASRFPEGVRQMSHWLKEGKLRYREHVIEGIENAPRALIGQLKGENIGKQLVKVADPE
jgi:NADPH-dependent curcumin reductase CurA